MAGALANLTSYGLFNKLLTGLGSPKKAIHDVSDRSGEPGGVSPRTLVIAAKNPGANAQWHLLYLSNPQRKREKQRETPHVIALAHAAG